MNLSIETAKVIRDGGIDATAALNNALSEALLHAPEHDHDELKRIFGKAMSEVFDLLLNSAIHAYPELSPDEITWTNVVKERAAKRA